MMLISHTCCLVKETTKVAIAVVVVVRCRRWLMKVDDLSETECWRETVTSSCCLSLCGRRCLRGTAAPCPCLEPWVTLPFFSPTN